MAADTPPDPGELTKERHLWAVFRTSQQLPATAGPGWAKFLGVLSVSLYTGFSFTSGLPATNVVAGAARDLAKDGLGFASQVIGFVLAGFTIFATMTARDFTIKLATTREQDTGLSYIKYIYLSFARVFAIYIGFICICLSIRIAGEPSGIVSTLGAILSQSTGIDLKPTVARGAFLAVASAFWIVAIELYSFTFNVYHTVMSGVRWEVMKHLAEQDAIATDNLVTRATREMTSSLQFRTTIPQPTSPKNPPSSLTLPPRRGSIRQAILVFTSKLFRRR